MTDIADKIYAATGLTLNAEAAAKIGQMIQVEKKSCAHNQKRAQLRHSQNKGDYPWQRSQPALKSQSRLNNKSRPKSS